MLSFFLGLGRGFVGSGLVSEDVKSMLCRFYRRFKPYGSRSTRGFRVYRGLKA